MLWRRSVDENGNEAGKLAVPGHPGLQPNFLKVQDMSFAIGQDTRNNGGSFGLYRFMAEGFE